MDYVCDRCEAALADGPCLAGAQYTLADIALLPYIQALPRSGPNCCNPIRAPRNGTSA